MPQQEGQQSCPHERRPGTTVCLHCRHEARVAAGLKRRRMMLRASAVGIVGVTVIAAIGLGANALRGGEHPNDRATNGTSSGAVSRDTSTTTVVASAENYAKPSSGSGQVEQQGEVTHPAHRAAALEPVVPAGDSWLPDSVLVTRTDSGVTVSFDTMMQRTRRPDKFERFVRSTLAAIYGAPADSALAHLHDGAIAAQGDLLNELPERGIRVHVRPGATLLLYPETRMGQDGPLVVRYRVSVVGG